jgi:hypothetical protein
MTDPTKTTEMDLRRIFSRFFHAEEVPFGLAAIRILLPLVLLCPMLPRWFHARELYSSDGAVAPLWIGFGYRDMLPELPGTLAVALFSILILSLVASSIGWRTRTSLILATVLYTYFNLFDAVSTMTKYSVIASHVLLLLSVSKCGAIWSVDSWLQRQRQQRDDTAGKLSAGWPRSAAWPRRLLQLLIGCVYFGAGVTKMHTSGFLTGEQLQAWLVTNVNYRNPAGEYLAQLPSLIVVFAYITVVWEIVFIFTAWRGWGRRIMLVTGIVFHFLTVLTLGLFVFPMICTTIYLAFLNEDDAARFAAVFRSFVGRIRAGATNVTVGPRRTFFSSPPGLLRKRSGQLFCLSVLAAAFAGAEIEYLLDPYGERRPEGPYELRALDTEFVESTLLGPPTPVRLIDKFESFEIGTALVGGVLAGRRTAYDAGETITAQCTLTPGHEDMWLECSLHDENDRLVNRIGQVAVREMLRCNFYYELNESLEAGDYSLVLSCAGRSLLRKNFTLENSRISAAAN